MHSSPFDVRLSARLTDVPLPDGLLARLRMIPLASDADFDRALTDIPVPAELTDRLSAIAAVPHRRGSSLVPSFVKQAAAAVAMFALGLGYVFSVTALVYSRFDQPLLAAEPLRSAWSRWSGATAGEDPWVMLEATTVESPLDTDAQRPMDTDAQRPMDTDAQRPMDTDAQPDHRTPAFDGPIALAEFSDSSTGPNKSGETPLLRLAMASTTASVEMIAERLSDWPIERSRVHLVAEANTGSSAGVLPWCDTVRQETVSVELSADDAGYRYCRREIESGRLPLHARVRVEDFLAAFDYDFVDRNLAEPRVDMPTISIAAGPSPYIPLSEAPAPGTDRRWLVAIGISQSGIADAPVVTLDFEAEPVKAYRIIGYGLALPRDDGPQSAGEGADGGSEAGRAFERASTVLLFEVELTDAEIPPAAMGEVRLAWRGVQGRSRVAEAVLSRRFFAETFETAPVGWRQAALVALAAESLAGSPFAEQVSLGDVAGLARKIEPLVDDPTGWREFIEMVGKAQSIRLVSQSLADGLPRPYFFLQLDGLGRPSASHAKTSLLGAF